MGVTFWIVPSEQDRHKLRRIMDLRPSDSQKQSDNSYPRFNPHITLASLPSSSDISLEKLRNAVPQSQPALNITFQSVDVGEHFFRSVYIAILPSPELAALHKKVHEALDIEPRTPSFPHISLCYISDEDAANGERLRYKQMLIDSGRLRANPDGTVSLNCGNDEREDWLSGFVAPEIWITTCDGPVEGWTVDDIIVLS
ncbi:LigT-like protein [Dendrothele bispora CBS 962.96]|uniref:LigT-like protein n=1 Tax=Dendrothele bispora (strain CBS 962.96) TaxID=1314807 RepID=A0A4S8KVZ1_DENBC|nr:LigT-like protein [Dendrothele bispora CBS 962.96]